MLILILMRFCFAHDCLIYFCLFYVLLQAGGMATTGTQRVMDVNPEQVHQRVPTYLGSADDVTELINALKK